MNEITSRPISPLTREPRAISPLRRRMLDEMGIRQFSDKTLSDYIRHVVTLTRFIGRSPDTATPADLRAFQVDQRAIGVQPPSMNGAVSALRFFFTYACDRPELGQYLRIVKQPQKLPVVLTQEEAGRLMEAAPGPKYRAIFGVAYGVASFADNSQGGPGRRETTRPTVPSCNPHRALPAPLRTAPRGFLP